MTTRVAQGDPSARRRRLLAWTLPIGALLAAPATALAVSINKEFKPQNEFKLDPWIPFEIDTGYNIIDLSLNKGVFFLLLSSIFTIVVMLWIGRRMEMKPNRVQAAVEAGYDLTNNQMTRENLDARMSGRWFAFIATLFFFILFNNLLGYLPLPTNTEHMVHVFGLDIPSFSIYAATANFSVPLILTLVVWFAYNIQGVFRKGPIKYVKGLMPEGVTGLPLILVGPLEIVSHFVRIISLSARLFANILAGHLLILLMGGGMVVLLGIEAVALLTIPAGVLFYLFEMGLVATLQAFIFAILSAIYLGEATAEAH
jgi:F-type H+-transporting ATPase subunit a